MNSFKDIPRFMKICPDGISGNSGNPWNFKPLGLASVIQNLVPCSADVHEKCSRKVQTEKSQLTKFESPLGTASRVSERCLWVRPSLSRNFRGSCFFRGIRVSAIYFRELSRNSWQETWFFSCVTHHVYWNAKKTSLCCQAFCNAVFFWSYGPHGNICIFHMFVTRGMYLAFHGFSSAHLDARNILKR